MDCPDISTAQTHFQTIQQKLHLICHPALSLSLSPLHGLGIFSSKPLPKATHLVTIPNSAFLSVHTATLFQNNPPSPSLCPLAFQLPAALLFEQLLSSRSRWSSYLPLLPSSLSHIPSPLRFSDPHLRSLFQGTAIDTLTINVRAALIRVFHSFIKPFFLRRAAHLSLDKHLVLHLDVRRFFLAFACVTSRAFHVDDLHGNSMLPVADLFNHSSTAEHVHVEAIPPASHTSDSEHPSHTNSTPSSSSSSDSDAHPCTEELRLVTVRPLAAGDEIFNTFGRKPNTILYLNYGFTQPSNPADTAFVHRSTVDAVLQALCKDTVTPPRTALIEAAEPVTMDEVVDDFFQVCTDGSFCHGLLVLLYLHVAPWAVLQRFEDDEVELLEHAVQLTVHDVLNVGKERVLAVLEGVVNAQLALFPAESSLESDLERVKEGGEGVEVDVVRIRAGQKLALKVACEKIAKVAMVDVVWKGGDGGDQVRFLIGEREVKRARKG